MYFGRLGHSSARFSTLVVEKPLALMHETPKPRAFDLLTQEMVSQDHGWVIRATIPGPLGEIGTVVEPVLTEKPETWRTGCRLANGIHFSRE